jgi:plastocyanin
MRKAKDFGPIVRCRRRQATPMPVPPATCARAVPVPNYVFRGDDFRNRPATARATPPAAGPNDVIIDRYAFMRPSLSVKVGTTVRWLNNDKAEHTVVVQVGAFTSEPLKSRTIKAGGSFSFTFSRPGRYDYFCSLPPAMTARIEVSN